MTIVHTTALPWDTAAHRAISRQMGLITRHTWVSHKTGPLAGFGGCLALVFLFPLWAAYMVARAALWLVIEAVLSAALLLVLLAGGCWRGYRILRHNPVGGELPG
jgi:hypothetical protein